jgi:hypothetical protein
MKLEALCKRLREDAQKLKEEKTTLEGMVESHDEPIMEMAEEYGLKRLGENDNDEDEMMMTKGTLLHPRHLLLCLRRSSKRKPPLRWFLNKKPLWHMR